ncbi:MAG TPA: hypothetical protein ENJ56_01800, partial [Anaerolineae bacterium]|nr:hypothetical protein [Anaerolineae bacterium]
DVMVEDSAETQDLPLDQAWPADRFGYGIQSHATIGDPAYPSEVIKNQLGLSWMKVQMRWADIQPAPDQFNWGAWDAVIDNAAQRNLRVMLSIVTAPAWSRAAGNENGPPDDYALYYEFLNDVLTRYAGKVHAVEIWNEQNLDREWATDLGVDPVRYVEFLEGAYNAVKSTAPNVIVISGALAPTGAHDPERIKYMNDLIWLDEAIGYGMLDYVDCVGAHHNGYNLPPDVAYDEVERVGSVDEMNFTGPWTNPHQSWSLYTTFSIMAEKVQAVKPDLKLCVTEFGWATSEGYDEVPASFEWVLDNSLEEQAAFIVQGYQQMRDSGDVWLAFLFNFDFGNKGYGPTDDAVPYSIVDINGVPRPAFGAIAGMEKTP